MTITAQQLMQVFPNAGPSAGVFVSALNTAMNHDPIVGLHCVAAFIAQIGHESGQLTCVREIWGPTNAQAKYEGRAGLGNTLQGEGSKYRGEVSWVVGQRCVGVWVRSGSADRCANSETTTKPAFLAGKSAFSI